jgi:hypothetical protein
LGFSDTEIAATSISFSAPSIGDGLPEKLSSLIEDNGYEVIIIDTLAAVAPNGRGGDVWKHQYAAITALQQVAREKHVAIVVVTHTKKNADAVAAHDAINSTGGTLAGADASWVFQKQKKCGPGEMCVTVEGRDFEGGEYMVRRNGAEWEMLGTADRVVPSQQEQTILKTLDAHGAPMQWSHLKRAAGIGNSFDAVLHRLLHKKQLVERDAFGNYKRAGMEDIFGAEQVG